MTKQNKSPPQMRQQTVDFAADLDRVTRRDNWYIGIFVLAACSVGSWFGYHDRQQEATHPQPTIVQHIEGPCPQPARPADAKASKAYAPRCHK